MLSIYLFWIARASFYFPLFFSPLFSHSSFLLCANESIKKSIPADQRIRSRPPTASNKPVCTSSSNPAPWKILKGILLVPGGRFEFDKHGRGFRSPSNPLLFVSVRPSVRPFVHPFTHPPIDLSIKTTDRFREPCRW